MTTEPRPSSQADHADASAPSVLLVDDNLQNLELIEAYLEDLAQDFGLELRRALNGEEALAAVAERRPELLVLDVMMPRMSGFQVCEALKGDDRTREIPVVVVTALNEVGDVERALEAGADDFLTKPVNRLELTTRVKSLLEVGRLRRRLGDAVREIDRLRDSGAGG
ncbi:MAG: response regulator [Planctomycetota bacterium]